MARQSWPTSGTFWSFLVVDTIRIEYVVSSQQAQFSGRGFESHFWHLVLVTRTFTPSLEKHIYRVQPELLSWNVEYHIESLA